MAVLSQSNKTALKAAFLADAPTVVQINTGQYGAVANIWNAAFSPDYWVFKELVDTASIGLVVNYIAVEAMTTANHDKVKTFYQMNPISFTPRSDIKSFFDNTFSGALASQGAASRAALDLLWRKLATRAERVCATTPGTGTTADPATLTFSGELDADDVQDILLQG